VQFTKSTHNAQPTTSVNHHTNRIHTSAEICQRECRTGYVKLETSLCTGADDQIHDKQNNIKCAQPHQNWCQHNQIGSGRESNTTHTQP